MADKNRTNLFIEKKLLQKLDYIAGMHFANKGTKATRTDVVNEALEGYIKSYEKEHNVEIPTN